MENVKRRCTSCGIYPLCEKISSPTGCCEKWIRRSLEQNDDSNQKNINKILVKFIELGKKKVSFEKYQEDTKIDFDWIKAEITPFISQDEFELKQNSKGYLEIYVKYGFIKAKQGKIQIIRR